MLFDDRRCGLEAGVPVSYTLPELIGKKVKRPRDYEFMKSNWKRYGVASLVILAGAGYTWFDFQSRHGEKALVARANQYWEARKANDYNTAYQLEAATVSGRLTPDEVDVEPEWGRRLVGYKIGNIVYYGDKAEIEISKEYVMREFSKPFGVPRPSKDLWTFVNGRWYHGGTEKEQAGVFDRKGITPPVQPTEAPPSPAQ